MAKTKKVREHNPIDWKRVFRMATAKKSNGQPRYSITEMAQALGYYNKQSNDPTQEFRGMLSRARTIGIRIDGKLVKLPKATVRRVVRAAAPKPKKVATAKATKKAAVKAAAPKTTKAPKVVKSVAKKVAKAAGKGTVAVQMHESGRVVKVKVGETEALVKKSQMVPQIANLAHEMGYDLVPKKDAAVPDVDAVTPTPKAESAAEPTPQVAPEAPVAETATEKPAAENAA